MTTERCQVKQSENERNDRDGPVSSANKRGYEGNKSSFIFDFITRILEKIMEKRGPKRGPPRAAPERAFQKISVDRRKREKG
jgi:hypothetical protein